MHVKKLIEPENGRVSEGRGAGKPPAYSVGADHILVSIWQGVMVATRANQKARPHRRREARTGGAEPD